MNLIILDLETQKLAGQVGGWSNIEALQVSVAVTWDEDNGYRTWWEEQVGYLLRELRRAKVIAGYNISAFDYRVLTLYGDVEGFNDKTFDLLDEIWQQARRRVGLNVVANLNLGEAKTHVSGISAVRLWEKGELEELAAYCQRDVELTKRLLEFWEDNGLLYISETDYVIWPGPPRRVIEEEEEL